MRCPWTTKPLALTFLLLTLAPAAHAGSGIDPDLLAGLSARSIGPAGMSGRVAAVEVVVSDPTIIYVGAATGGVWKSTNGGLTFTSIFDDQPVHAVGAVAVNQSNPSIVWVGTGEGNPRNSASVGMGVFRSLDGGETWQAAGLEKTERIHRLLLHPTEPLVAYACALGQEWGENPERGVFKTVDGGRNWTKILYVDDKTGCGDLAMDPNNPGHLIAAVWQFRRWPYFFKSGGPGSGIYSTFDGGANWKKLQEEDGLPKGELGRTGIAFSPSHPAIVYLVVEAATNALLRSEDGGKTFTTVSEDIEVSPRPFYYADLRVDPAWPNRVYSLATRIRVSDDGGKSFRQLEGTARRAIHGDYHALWIHPHDPRFLIVGEDGGIALSNDHGKSFRFVSTLPLAQFYHVAYDFELPYNLYGGLQDNGSWRGPSNVWQQGGIRSHLWRNVGGGDGFDVQPDAKDANIGYSMSQGGFLTRYNLRSGEEKNIKPAPPAGVELRFNWNAGFAIDPFDPATIYYGSQFLHRSKDRGDSWETVSPDLTSNNPEWQKASESGGLTPDVTAAENHCSILTIAPSPKARGVIWVGTDDGRLQVTKDGGATWASVEKALPRVPANTWIPHIEASKFDPAEAFVVLDNHRRSDWNVYAYRTRDYGKTWTSLATSDLRGYALAIEQDHVERNLLFLGTEFGLWFSTNGGTDWTPLQGGLPTASVMDLAVHPRDNDLIIATHGRGLYVLDDITPLRKLSAEVMKAPLHLFPTAPAQQHWMRPGDTGYGLGAGEFRGTAREYGALITYVLNAPGLPLPDAEKERTRKEKERQEKPNKDMATPATADAGKGSGRKRGDKPEATIEIADVTGKVIRSFQAPATQGVNRAAWDLTRDTFKRSPRGDEPRPFERSGPEMAPGTYSVTVKYGAESAKGTLTVLPDPEATNSPEDWQKRAEAIERTGALNDRAVDLMVKIQRTRADIELVAKKVQDAAKDRGEKDEKKLAEDPLLKAGEALKEGLGKLENRLWTPPTAKGIQPDPEVYGPIGEAGGSITSSWAPPTANDLALITLAESRLTAFEKDLAAFYNNDVAAYVKQVNEAGVGLFGGR